MNEQECQPSSHAQAKGTTRAVAVVRASTGLTTHRPASARVCAGCHGSQDPPAGRNRKLVCEPHDSTGEPGAGNRPAGFGERGEETCPRDSDCGPVRKRRMSHRLPTGYASPLDSTPSLPRPPDCGLARRAGAPVVLSGQTGTDARKPRPPTYPLAAYWRCVIQGGRRQKEPCRRLVGFDLPGLISARVY